MLVRQFLPLRSFMIPPTGVVNDPSQCLNHFHKHICCPYSTPWFTHLTCLELQRKTSRFHFHCIAICNFKLCMLVVLSTDSMLCQSDTLDGASVANCSGHARRPWATCQKKKDPKKVGRELQQHHVWLEVPICSVAPLTVHTAPVQASYVSLLRLLFLRLVRCYKHRCWMFTLLLVSSILQCHCDPTSTPMLAMAMGRARRVNRKTFIQL